MKLVIEGFDEPIVLGGGPVAVLEIHDKQLYSRICQSLISEKGEEAIEPFSLWEEDGSKRSARNAILPVTDPFDLPWEERSLLSDLQETVEEAYAADDQARRKIDEAAHYLREEVSCLGLRLQSDYEFALEWDLGRFLKAFDFSVDGDPADSLLENLIKFVKFASDIQCHQVVLFMNLKSFLEKNELEEFYREAFFCDLNILLLESAPDDEFYAQERKTTIDQDFLMT